VSLLIAGVSVVDATRQEPRRDAWVLVDGRLIRDVGHGPLPRADRRLDLGGAWLLPGLWDVHTHLRSTTWTGRDPVQTFPDTVLEQGRNAMDALGAGVTSLRVVGVAGWADVAWREAFATGPLVGPRLFCCGDAIRTTAGHDPFGGTRRMVAADGPDAFVQVVREQILHGVDQIKLITTGGIMGSGHDVMSAVMFLREELTAAMRIARQRGLPVAVHATAAEAVKWAVEAGAHSIEHGYLLDEEAAALMARRGVYYVPTLALSHLTRDQALTSDEHAYCAEHVLPDGFRERANRFAPDHEASFRLAREAGVKIASGSDQGPPREAALLEIELLARTGLGAHGAIVAATRTAAEVCRADDRLGTVEPGKLADLIAVSANPLEDIAHLRQLLLVIKDGQVVVDRRARERLAVPRREGASR
jgi:imidazolonepropionase-like amidohydrolase